MPIAAVLVAVLWSGDVSAVNLARASRIAALRSADVEARDAAADRIRELLADDASHVPLYVELALLFAGRAQMEGARWTMQARWVLARAREVANDIGANERERAMIENAAGVIELQAGDAMAARRRFDRAAEIDPAYAPGQLNRGILAAHWRQYDVAIEALGAGLRDPAYAKDVDSAVALGRALAKRRDPVRALKVLRGIARRSGDPHTDLVLGIVLMDDIGPLADEGPTFERAPYDEARVALTRYIATRPTNIALTRAAQLRLAELDAMFRVGDPPHAVEPEALRLERLHREQETAEKKRLRALEAEMQRQQMPRR
jgi:tetratricopeptide (TPR) repeat protein